MWRGEQNRCTKGSQETMSPQDRDGESQTLVSDTVHPPVPSNRTQRPECSLMEVLGMSCYKHSFPESDQLLATKRTFNKTNFKNGFDFQTPEQCWSRDTP